MSTEIETQVIKDIIFLIKDGIGVTYNGSRFDYMFNMIFDSYMVEIIMDIDMVEMSICVYKGSECDIVHLETDTPIVMELIEILKDKFNIDRKNYMTGFIDKVGEYVNRSSDNNYLSRQLSNLIKSEQFEKAEEIKKRMKENEKRKKESNIDNSVKKNPIKPDINKDNL